MLLAIFQSEPNRNIPCSEDNQNTMAHLLIEMGASPVRYANDRFEEFIDGRWFICPLPPTIKVNTRDSGVQLGAKLYPFKDPFRVAEAARLFSHFAHYGQLRKYTGEPYHVHTDEVAEIVQEYRHTQEMVAGAHLHDIVEDTRFELGFIKTEFGPEVHRIVRGLTDAFPVMPGFNRARRKALECERYANEKSDVQTLKCADLLSNRTTIVKYDPGFAKLYLVEGYALAEVMTKANSKLRRRVLKAIDDTLKQMQEDDYKKKRDGSKS